MALRPPNPRRGAKQIRPVSPQRDSQFSSRFLSGWAQSPWNFLIKRPKGSSQNDESPTQGVSLVAFAWAGCVSPRLCSGRRSLSARILVGVVVRGYVYFALACRLTFHQPMPGTCFEFIRIQVLLIDHLLYLWLRLWHYALSLVAPYCAQSTIDNFRAQLH